MMMRITSVTGLKSITKIIRFFMCFISRQYVLHHIQHLKFLDSRRVSESELMEAKRRGQFMKVVRPKATDSETKNTPPPTHPFTPLPKHMRDPTDQRGKK